jgi:hypothetical protein
MGDGGRSNPGVIEDFKYGVLVEDLVAPLIAIDSGREAVRRASLSITGFRHEALRFGDCCLWPVWFHDDSWRLVRGVEMARDVNLGLLPPDEAVVIGVPRPISIIMLLLESSEKPLDTGEGSGPPGSGALSLALRGNGKDSGAVVSSSICIGDSFKTFSSPGVLGTDIDGFRDFLTFSSGILGSSCGGSFFDIGLGELKPSLGVSSSRSN